MNIEVPVVEPLPKKGYTPQPVVEDTDLERVGELYSFRNAGAVKGFLQHHQHVIDFLIESYPYVSKHFGRYPEIILELIKDQEIDASEQLVAYIKTSVTSLPVDEALARLDKLDEEWLIDQLERVDGLFNFNLEIL
jgi:hypothetical protein